MSGSGGGTAEWVLLGLDPQAGGDQVTEKELRDLVATHEQLDREERRMLADVFDAATGTRGRAAAHRGRLPARDHRSRDGNPHDRG
jgi:hypothetical protein